MKYIIKFGFLVVFVVIVFVNIVFVGENKWGVFVVDMFDKSKVFYYGVGGGDMEKEVFEYVMKFCKEEGGKECMFVVIYEKCGVLVFNGKLIWWGVVLIQKDVEMQVLQGCKDGVCKVVSFDCN